MIKQIFPLLILSALLYSQPHYYQNGHKVHVTQQKSLLRFHSSVTTFVDENNTTLGVTDEIIVEMANDTFDSLANKYQLTLLEKIGKRFYRCKVSNPQEIFQTAAKIYHEEGVKASHPNFIKQRYAR